MASSSRRPVMADQTGHWVVDCIIAIMIIRIVIQVIIFGPVHPPRTCLRPRPFSRSIYTHTRIAHVQPGTQPFTYLRTHIPTRMHAPGQETTRCDSTRHKETSRRTSERSKSAPTFASATQRMRRRRCALVSLHAIPR